MKINNLQLGKVEGFKTDFTKESPSATDLFESYFKLALKEIETKELAAKEVETRVNLAHDKISEALDVLQRFSKATPDFSSSQTIGDFLLTRAFEVDKLVSTLPESGLKSLLKELCVFLGVEAQKIKQGFYS